MLHVYIDGSGKTGKYVYLIEETNEVKIFQKEKITNNQAEYLAIIEALKNSPENFLTIFSDSRLVVSQLTHKFAIKNENLRKLALQVWNLVKGRRVEFVWIPRNKNKAGKLLG